MTLCCSALTISDFEATQRGGLLCAFGWYTLGQYRHSAVNHDLLSSGKRTEQNIAGNPKNIHSDLIGKATPPVERHRLPKGMVRHTSTGKRSSKRMLLF